MGRSLAPTEHVTSPVGYVRLHGRNYKEWFEADNRDDRYNYLYTKSESARLERQDREHRGAARRPPTSLPTIIMKLVRARMRWSSSRC